MRELQVTLERERREADERIAALSSDVQFFRSLLVQQGLSSSSTATRPQPISARAQPSPLPRQPVSPLSAPPQQSTNPPTGPPPAPPAQQQPTEVKQERKEKGNGNRHPPLKPQEAHFISPTKARQLGLPVTSRTDFVVTVQPPPNAIVHPLLLNPRLPSRQRQPTLHRQILVEIFTHKAALNIPLPAIPSVLLSCPDTDALQEKIASWSGDPASPLLAYLTALYGRNPADLNAAPLPSLPANLLIPSWADLLGPSTRSLQFRQETRTHTILLSLPNPLICELVCLHFERFTHLQYWHAGATVSSFTHGESTMERDWVAHTRRSGAIQASINLSQYTIRYSAHQVTGFPLGPQWQPRPDQSVSWQQLYGNNQLFINFLESKVPHCQPELHVSPSGFTSRTVTFYHEAQYLYELYALHGASSPPHGVLRPINLHGRLRQCKKASTQCCTFCWGPGHGHHACPYNAAATDPGHVPDREDTGYPPLRYNTSACKLCYSFAHTDQQCDLPVKDQLCRLCGKAHNTASCPDFSVKWVPLSLPPTLAPSGGKPKQVRPSPIITQNSIWAAKYRAALPSSQQLSPPFLAPHDFPALLPHPSSDPTSLSLATGSASPTPATSSTDSSSRPFLQTAPPQPTQTATTAAVSGQLAELTSTVGKLLSIVSTLQGAILSKDNQIDRLTSLIEKQFTIHPLPSDTTSMIVAAADTTPPTTAATGTISQQQPTQHPTARSAARPATVYVNVNAGVVGTSYGDIHSQATAAPSTGTPSEESSGPHNETGTSSNIPRGDTAGGTNLTPQPSTQ